MCSTQNSAEQHTKNCSRVYPNPDFEALIASESEQLQSFARAAFYDNPEQFPFVGGTRLRAADVQRIAHVIEHFEHGITSDGTEKKHLSTDPEFENFISNETIGVQDSARSQYYGEAYSALFTPVLTNPQCVSPRKFLIPTHTDVENERAGQLVEQYTQLHPDEAKKYGYQT